MPHRTCPPNPNSLLLYLRTRQGLSQAELGKRCGVKPNAICQFELRGAPLAFENLCSLASYFGVTLDALARDDLSAVAELPSVSPPPLKPDRRKLGNIGRMGVDFVIKQELEKLKGTPYENKVIPGPASDTKGYCDLISFDPDTRKAIFIGVKSTVDEENEIMYFSREELKFLKQCIQDQKAYELHRVYHVGTDRITQSIYTAQQTLDMFNFEPFTYIVHRKE